MWGEKSNPPAITQSDLSQADCSPIEKIITGSEQESALSFQCWSGHLNQIWTQVEGTKADLLSDAEIATLVHKNILHVQGDPESALRKIYAWKKLFGFPESLSRKKLSDWLEWAQKHRPTARELFQKFNDSDSNWSFADIRKGAELISSALHRMNWAMSSEQFARSLTTAFATRDPEILDAVTPGSEVAINVLNMICPTFPIKDLWNSSGIAKCLDLMVTKFEMGGPWFEFLLNPVKSLSGERISEIQTSLEGLQNQINVWFLEPSLSPLYPTRWIDFSRKMKASPPDNILDSLRVIRRFKHRSTEEAIFPEELIWIFKVAQKAQNGILNGITHFLSATQQGLCIGMQPTDWTGCVLPNYPLAASLSPAIKTALKVKNLHHGQASAPLNGGEFSKIQIFHEFSDQIIGLFHDDCPEEETPHWKWPFKRECNPEFITTELGDENDKLVQLISVGVNTAENIERFIENIRRKFQHLPLKENSRFLDRHWNIGGFARLIAMTSDILVRRSPEESTILAKFLSMLVLPNKTSLSLDRLAATAVLTTVDSLPQYRRSYISILGEKSPSSLVYSDSPENPGLWVRRSAVISALPKILKSNFPRTFESCEKFDFKKSCGLAMDGLLSQSPKDSDMINVTELDILTVLATSMEGMVDSCDRDANAELHWIPLSGDEELDCGYIRTREVLKRLIDSKIVDLPGGGATRAKVVLWITDSNPITRMSGKVAMVRGTTEGIAYDFLLAPFNLDATIGSIYGLIADIIAQDEARK